MEINRNKLPLVKFPRIISIHFYFFLFISIFLSSCTSEYNLATQKEELYLHSTDKEVKMGDAFAAQIEKHYKDKILTDVDINERVQGILNRIVAVCDRQELVYFIKVIDEDMINAVSLPGGHMYVFKGLIDKVKNDDQLAGVIAHEVAHITARHAVKRLQQAYAALLLQVASVQAGGGVAAGVNLALNSIFSEYSQEAEFEADRLGVKYLRDAGYRPEAMIEMLEILEIAHEKEPIRPYSYFRTHPHIHERMGAVNQAVTGKLEFRDYIRMMGNE